MFHSEGSTFEENAALYGGAIHAVGATCSFKDTTFQKNFAYKGGALKVEGISIISQFEGVTATQNFAYSQGGVIDLTGNSKISISSSEFSHNYSEDLASVLYFMGTQKNEITSSSFILNKAEGGNTVMLLFAETDIIDVTVKDNTADYESSGIFINFCTVQITNSKFETEELLNGAITAYDSELIPSGAGGFISITSGSEVTITSSIFKNGYSIEGGAIYLSGSSQLTIVGSNFID